MTKLPERKRYIVVCYNEKQVKDLFNRSIAFYKTTTNARLMRVNKSDSIIAGPIDTIQFVSERQMASMMDGLHPLNCTLVSWKTIDKRLNCMEDKK